MRMGLVDFEYNLLLSVEGSGVFVVILFPFDVYTNPYPVPPASQQGE